MSSEPTGFTWETISTGRSRRGFSATYFNSDLPFSALYGQQGLRWTWGHGDFEPPKLPDPTAVAAVQCSAAETRAPPTARACGRSPTTWSSSRPAACSGDSATRSGPARYDQIFREPDSVQRALESSRR